MLEYHQNRATSVPENNEMLQINFIVNLSPLRCHVVSDGLPVKLLLGAIAISLIGGMRANS